MKQHDTLMPALARLAALQQSAFDKTAVHEVSTKLAQMVDEDIRQRLETVADLLDLPAPKWLKRFDPGHVPLLACHVTGEHKGTWGVIKAMNYRGELVFDYWSYEQSQFLELTLADGDGLLLARQETRKPFVFSKSPLFAIIWQEIFSHKVLLRDAALNSFAINILASLISFYSMQVYDRVVPSGAAQTLFVLTVGVLTAMVFEYGAKLVRFRLYERLINEVDGKLARLVFKKFLSVRLDQLPRSVGGLAEQMRGYETVRNFFTMMTTQAVIDVPFALFYAALIAFVGGVLALVPLTFLFLSFYVNFMNQRRFMALARETATLATSKAGLLVETVEGAETIKSGQSGWRMLGHWVNLTDAERDAMHRSRHFSETSSHMTQTFQQLSYVGLVAFGALLVSQGQTTMGALIACSILSGRVLQPLMMIPMQLQLYAQVKASLAGLDALWALEDDHSGVDRPIIIEKFKGAYRLENVVGSYGQKVGVSVGSLVIAPGEKVGVIGPVGAGKTTLLRLLSGMYKPDSGRVLLDDVDLAHISKPNLAESLGYVQQEGRLFAGTLRENLILGLVDPGDEVILEAAKITGLLQAVIASHPNGLQQPIFEGGNGLSGGQRQLVNLTRAFLRKPKIWLLDEPTASMDRQLENQVKAGLRAAIQPSDTLILVTHKLEMLELVHRVLVLANNQLVMDGPRDQVLQKLQGSPAQIQS